MRELFVDCSRGLATDMLCGALLGLFDDKDKVLHEMQVCLPKNVVLSCVYANSYERQGLLFKVGMTEYHHTHGTHFQEVLDFIKSTDFCDSVKCEAVKVYDIIADAECAVHNENRDTIHFHEVGQKRAIAGVLCACYLMQKLKKDKGVDKVVFSKINTGFGKTTCAHGEVDVPAPATKKIIDTGLPCFHNDIYGELCTPCGCALAKVFADEFCDVERNVDKNECLSSLSKENIGLGTRDIGISNGVICKIVERH